MRKTENFVGSKYEEISKDKGKKAIFRKFCEKFKIVDGFLRYKVKRRVVLNKDRKRIIICDVHGGLGDDPKANVLATHRGRESAYQKFAERFYWHSVIEDVKEYIKNCQNCQQQGIFLKD